MGDGGVGKSCLIKRYCERRVSRSLSILILFCFVSCFFLFYCCILIIRFQFVSKHVSTIGVDFGVKPVELHGNEVKVSSYRLRSVLSLRNQQVNFWDLAGPKEYFDVRNEFYKDSQGVGLRRFPDCPILTKRMYLSFRQFWYMMYAIEPRLRASMHG